MHFYVNTINAEMNLYQLGGATSAL